MTKNSFFQETASLASSPSQSKLQLQSRQRRTTNWTSHSSQQKKEKSSDSQVDWIVNEKWRRKESKERKTYQNQGFHWNSIIMAFLLTAWLTECLECFYFFHEIYSSSNDDVMTLSSCYVMSCYYRLLFHPYLIIQPHSQTDRVSFLWWLIHEFVTLRPVVLLYSMSRVHACIEWSPCHVMEPSCLFYGSPPPSISNMMFPSFIVCNACCIMSLENGGPD